MQIAPSIYRQDPAALSTFRRRRAAPGGDASGSRGELRRPRGPQDARRANRRGHRIARCTVHRLMRADGLRGIGRAEEGPRTTVQGTGPDTRPDLLDRDFKAPAPDRSGSRTSPAAGPSPAGSTPRSSSTSSPAEWPAGSRRRTCAQTSPSTPSRWVCGPTQAGQDTNSVIAHSDKGL